MSSSQTPQSIQSGLSQLRGRLARWLLVHGVSHVLVAIVIWIAVDFAIDRLFHMDWAQRFVMLLLALAILAFLFYRRVLFPMATQPTDDALVLEIEQRKPEAGQSLISALQFSRMEQPESRGYSPSMVQATIDSGADFATKTKFGDIVHGKGHLKNLLILVIAAALLFGAAVATFATDSMGTWFNRNVLLGNQQWPMDVMMSFDHTTDGKLVIPRGDDWPLSVLIGDDSRIQPDEVFVDLQTSVGERTERLEKAADGKSFTSTLIHADDIQAVRARADRSYTQWIPVEFIERPEITDLQLTVIPPDYTSEKPTDLPRGFGPYLVLPGSQLKLRGTASKPLSRVNIAAAGWKLPLTVNSSQATEFSALLDAEHVVAATYNLTAADTETALIPGRQRPGPLLTKSPLRFTLRSKTDRAPQLRAKLTGVGSMVVADAVVPMSSVISDDYSVTEVRLHHKSIDPEGKPGEEESASLNQIAKVPAARIDLNHNLELADYSVTVGNTFHFHLAADDNNTVTGPGTGESSTFLLRIVSSEELRSDLLRREKELRLEFERIIKAQDTMLTDTQALLTETKGAQKLKGEQLELLIKIQKRQKVVGTNLANVARRFENIAIEVGNNRLEEENGPLQTRLKDEIVKPVWDVADDALPRLVDAFDAVRQKSAVIGERNKAGAGVIRRQEDVLADLREILTHMVKAEGFQEAVNMLYEVERAQSEIIKRTETERQKEIRKLLGNDTDTDTNETDADDSPQTSPESDSASDTKDGDSP